MPYKLTTQFNLHRLFGSFALTVLLTLATWPVPALAQGDCPGDIGCTSCLVKISPSGVVLLFTCRILNQNGGCACFTWETEGELHCQNWGSCVFTGWSGGDPPRV